MGIRGFNTLVKRFNVIESIPLSELATALGCKRVAVDTNIIMYASMHRAIDRLMRKQPLVYSENEGWTMFDRKEMIKGTLAQMCSYASALKTADIQAIYVFDGDSPVEKAEEKIKRTSQLRKIESNTQSLRKCPYHRDAYIRSLKNGTSFSQEEKEEVMKFMASVGCDVMRADYEGEALCVGLCKDGVVDGVISKDTDLYAYNCPIIISTVAVDKPLVPKTNIATVIRLDKLLQAMKITPSQLTSLCIMCGTDYNANVRDYGPVKCYRAILAHATFKGVCDSMPWMQDIPHDKVLEIYMRTPSGKKVKLTERDSLSLLRKYDALNENTLLGLYSKLLSH